MVSYLYIGIAGSLGALSRMLISDLLSSNDTVFPWGTLLCNLIGCLLLSYFTFAAMKRLSTQVKLMITTGFIGAFTTFSTFSVETILLLEADKVIMAFTYVLASLLGGMMFAWLGYELAMLGKRRGEASHG